MKNLFLFITLFSLLTYGNSSFSQWTTIATDATGDGYAGNLLDGTQLEYQYDDVTDSLWFKITNTGISGGQSADLGINIMVNLPSGGSTFNFWGANNANAYHKLVTAWVTGSAPSNYTGTIGIANAAGVVGGAYTNLFSNNLDITVSTSSATVVIGINRADLVPNADLGQAILVAAAVGSSSFWNDDIYSSTGTMTLSSTIISVSSIAVASQGGATTIATSGGSLQMLESVQPLNATDNTVIWSVINQTGSGSINSSGVLSAISDGTVNVRATANDGSGIYGELMITISNQTAGFNHTAESTTFSVYPNPVINQFTAMDQYGQIPYGVEIYDIFGAKLEAIYGAQTVDVPYLSKGTYFLILYGNNGDVIGKQKFVKL